MNDAKYIGLDVHQATISAAVLDSSGRPISNHEDYLLNSDADPVRRMLWV